VILPLIVHYAEQGQREFDRYAGWSAAIERLRDDWAGKNETAVPQLRDYLQDIAEQYELDALQDLIAEHMRLSWQADRGTRLEAYIETYGQEFEELASPAVVSVDLVEDEFLTRYCSPHGDTPALDEYEKRFPERPDVIERLKKRYLRGGRYVKLQKRGQGAMGHVWEAYDRQLCRRVAIKQPKPGLSESLEILQRFAAEARVTAGLEHTSIVTVHEYEHDKSQTPFYVMRLVEGQTFSEQIRDYHQPPVDRSTDERRLLWHRLLQSFVAVSDGVAYAHAHQVLHRDLKPGNILVGEFGETVVLDWGMAKRMRSGFAASATGDCAVPRQVAVNGEATQMGLDEPSADVVAGTPQYMAPEQAGGIADARSDVFGLGAMLYEILTNRPPHDWADGAQPADWMRIVREAQFTPPRCLNPQAPRALEAVCLKALARDPADRYQRVDELSQEMRRHLAGEPVTAWTEPYWGRGWRMLRRLCRSVGRRPQVGEALVESQLKPFKEHTDEDIFNHQ